MGSAPDPVPESEPQAFDAPAEPRGPPPVPVPLQYSARARPTSAVLQCVVGAVASAGATVGSVFLVARFGLRGAVLGPLITASVLALAAIHFSRRPARRPLAGGILIGIALSIIAAGACWVAIRRG